MRFAHGRWDREQPHVLEVVSLDPGGISGACNAVCTCGFEGELRRSTAEADADAIEHERTIFEIRKAGGRLVRGRVE